MATQHSNRRHEEIRDQKVSDWIDANSLKGSQSDFWPRLARDVARDATSYGREHNLSTEEWGSFDGLLNDALEVVETMMRATNGGYIEDGAKVQPWRHERFVLERALKIDAPIIYKDIIEDAAGQYLKLPFRSRRMDYLLVELLVACELFAFARQMAWVLKRSTLSGWAKNRAYSGAFWLVVVLGADWLFNKDWSTAIFWIYVAETALSLIGLFRPSKAAKLLSEMIGVYAELGPSGPYSARHIEHRARSAADKGVVFPAPLFVMLDDINRRGGQF